MLLPTGSLPGALMGSQMPGSLCRPQLTASTPASPSSVTHGSGAHTHSSPRPPRQQGPGTHLPHPCTHLPARKGGSEGPTRPALNTPWADTALTRCALSPLLRPSLAHPTLFRTCLSDTSFRRYAPLALVSAHLGTHPQRYRYQPCTPRHVHL